MDSLMTFIPGYTTLTYFATPPHSYIGAAIFLSYIAAALYFSTTIIYSLYTQYSSIYHASEPPSQHPGFKPKGSKREREEKSLEFDKNVKVAREARKRHIQIYAFLASISFALLSFNMSMFLIAHYARWSGSASWEDVTLQGVKRWMLESSLFRDFAAELVRDPPSAVWMQASVLATWFWGVWVAQKAIQHQLPTSITRPYILLSQILPISFTASLFLIQLHLCAPDIAPPRRPRAPKNTPIRTPLASLQIPNILLNALLLASVPLRRHPLFTTLVSLERALLFLPHTGMVNLRDDHVVKSISVSGGFVVANLMLMRKEVVWKAILRAGMRGGWAVRALGWDMLLGGGVAGVLGWGQGV